MLTNCIAHLPIQNLRLHHLLQSGVEVGRNQLANAKPELLQYLRQYADQTIKLSRL
jgi:hypothetical protein